MHIQYLINGQEYTTRHLLAEKYHLSKCGGILQQVLEEMESERVQHLNQHYFLKAQVEAIMESRLQAKKRF